MAAAREAAMDWLTSYKIPLGKWISGFVDFLNEHAAFLFNATSDGLGFLIDGLIDLMQAAPPLLLVAIFAALAYWLHRSGALVAMVVVSLLLIMNLGYWAETMETLALVIFAAGLCMVIGVPIGISATPAPTRLPYPGVAWVPRPLREAGGASGATRRQLLWKVELPYAMP